MNELGIRKQIKRILGLRDDKCKMLAQVESFLKEKGGTKWHIKHEFAMKKYSKTKLKSYI